MKKSLLAIIIANVFAASAYADTNSTEAEDIEGSAQLETIVVSDTPFSQQVGTQKLTEEQIKSRPLGNGNITELLKNNPNVQFSNLSDTSTTAGELAPNEVSIHGEAFYNNNYTINGLSNNDNMNPGENNSLSKRSGATDPAGYSPTDLPAGGTQSFWIDTNLIKSVVIFPQNMVISLVG